MVTGSLKIALVGPGDQEMRDAAEPSTSRFAPLFAALQAVGHDVELVIYNDDFSDEVKDQLVAMDVVLVWVNPIHEGRTRAVLDQMLREVAEQGVLVSAHPDAIMALGTKQVLYDTRDMGWGCHTDLYRSPAELVAGLQASLASGPRVLKQHRGSSGAGVWSAALAVLGDAITPDTDLLVRHAQRGSFDQIVTLGDFCDQLGPHLEADGLLIDQAFQSRIGEGMVRCYLVKDRVAGFGHQQINALIPADIDEEAPTPGPRLYHPSTMAEYQRLLHKLEEEWLPELTGVVGLAKDQLPLLWDCDFLLGPADQFGNDTYVLCEINVSSVAPFPDSVIPALIKELTGGVP